MLAFNIKVVPMCYSQYVSQGAAFTLKANGLRSLQSVCRQVSIFHSNNEESQQTARQVLPTVRGIEILPSGHSADWSLGLCDLGLTLSL